MCAHVCVSSVRPAAIVGREVVCSDARGRFLLAGMGTSTFGIVLDVETGSDNRSTAEALKTKREGTKLTARSSSAHSRQQATTV